MSALRRGLAAAALLIALVAGGCGNGGSATSTVTTGPEAVGGDAPPVPTGNGKFSPDSVFREASPGVVTIRSIFQGGAASLLGGGGGGGGQQGGLGSGFVINDDGEIATNAHVVTDGQAGGGSKIRKAKEVFVVFNDRNQVPARIIGFDPFADVALIKVDPDGLDLHPVKLADKFEPRVGEPVAAIGSPFGEEQSLSVGIISAVDRTIQSLTDFQIDGAIQTDASINPGNSGGPLLDADANVIGINQQIDTTTGGNQGVGFAVPIDLVKRSIDALRKSGKVDYAYIGVTTQPLYPQLADKLGIDADTGALVASVVALGPADEAGLRGGDSTVHFQGQDIDAGGDVIVSVDGQKLVGEADLPRIVSRLDPGEKVDVDVIRDGKPETISVTLGERPARVPTG